MARYNSQRGPVPSELAWLIDTLDDLADRVKVLEAPSGEALGSTVAKLQALVTDIQAQLDAWVASRWTNAEITTQIDAAVATRWTNAQIDARIYALIASHMAGNVSIGGELFVNGAVTMPDVYNTDLVAMGGARTAAWVRTGGRLGHT